MWILVITLNIMPMIAVRLLPEKNPDALKRAVTLPDMTSPQRIVYWAVMIPYFLMYPVAALTGFSDQPTLLLVGGAIFAFALILRTRAMIDYATTPAGTLITGGVYRLSRNPGYFAAALALLGLAIMGESALIVAVALYFFVGYQWVVGLEEAFCLRHYPQTYPAYKDRVARNFLLF